MTKKTLGLLIISVLAFSLFALNACDSSKSKTPSGESLESITLGTYKGDLSSLIWIAEDRGYFAEHGLKVNINWYESGVTAMKDLLAGKVDFATASEFVVARHIVKGDDLRIIASLCKKTDDLKVVARRDRGITQISDIRHKRVGITYRSNAEFFLDLLLTIHNIPLDQVQRVNLLPSDQVMAIPKGELDAAVVWEPFATSMANELGSNAVIFPAQSAQGYYWLLLGTEDRLKKRHRAVQNLMLSLISADEFLKKHRDEARKIVARKLGFNDLPGWESTDFDVSIDRSLTLAMEAQIRWMDPSLVKRPSETPNLLKFIYFDALKSAQPQRIKMTH